MPSFEMYKKLYGGRTHGQVRKEDSDMILDAAWWEDTGSQVGYFYSQGRDDAFDKAEDLRSNESVSKIPIDVKFYEIEYNSLSKDDVGQHLEFRPGFDYREAVPYYDGEFKEPLGAMFPDGMYCDLADSMGVYHRWLCAGHYRRRASQFPSYILLPCDFKAKWVYGNEKMESWGVLRSQSSYNSGVWSDYKATFPENQKMLWLPFNKVTSTIFYDQRMAISQDRKVPVVWACSKVEDMNVKGVVRYTFKQDQFDEHRDYRELDKDGKLVGVWCDYYKMLIDPSAPVDPPPSIYCKVSYSGASPSIKSGGNYKKFTAVFYDAGEPVDFRPGEWSFMMDGQDASSLVDVQRHHDLPLLKENQIRIKFIGGDSYIGKNLDVRFASVGGVSASATVNIQGV